MREKLEQWLAEHRDEAVAFLRQVVQAESTQGRERRAQETVAEYLRRIGLEVDVWEPDAGQLAASPFFCSSRSNFAGSPNVVGLWKGAGGGRSIILNGHIDVVPVGDRSQWRHDPWAGEVADGRMYGRGITDMKGGDAAMFLAVAALKSLGVHLRGDVIVQSVVEEESGGAGTLAAVLRGYRADGAIIPEPTGMRIFPKQQGSMWFRIVVAGRAAHGGTRYEGVSAIEKSTVVLAALNRLEAERNRPLADDLYQGIPIPVPINVGVIRGGDWPSMVPDQVVLEGRLGVAPHETPEQAQQEMAAILRQLGERDPWFAEHPVALEWFGARWLPGNLNPQAELVQVLAESYRTVLGAEPEMAASPWGTDAGLLAASGGTPGVVFGPGVTAVAHYPNEYIELDRVFETAAILALTVAGWCGLAEPLDSACEEE